MSLLSSFLFARPSFVEGAARLVDLGDTLTEYNRSPTGAEADFYAISADWSQIGQDLKDAMLWHSQQMRRDSGGVQAIAKE